MRKSLVTRMVYVLLAFALFVACTPLAMPKSNVKAATQSITIYSWEDYMEVADGTPTADNDLLYQFEQETGIKVNYYTFATNEQMYNELKNSSGCDLVCPSEYMIMKMKEEGLIKKYEAPKNWIDHGSPYIKDTFKKLGLTDDNGDETYAIGFMWGTMGLLYNTETVDVDDISHWKGIWNPKYKNKVTIKDSIRDTYIMALGAHYETELIDLKDSLLNKEINLEKYTEQLNEIFNRTDDDTIEYIEKDLLELKGNLNSFEVDSGKNDMISGKISINFAWSGDAVYAMDEAEAAGKTFGYVVPEEGSNVWFDGWVMPNGADEELALKFLNFISSPESAIRNMDYIGYVSCVAGDDVFDYLKESEELEGEYELDLGYFFGDDKDYKVKVSSPYGRTATQYPDKDIIDRCAVMQNFDEPTLEKINDMWNRVKFITFPLWIIIVFVALVVLAIVAFVLYKFKDKIFVSKSRVKKGYHVVNKEVM